MVNPALTLTFKNQEKQMENEGGNKVAGTNVEMNTGTNVDRGD